MSKIGNEILKRIGRKNRRNKIPGLFPERGEWWICLCGIRLKAAFFPSKCPACGYVRED